MQQQQQQQQQLERRLGMTASQAGSMLLVSLLVCQMSMQVAARAMLVLQAALTSTLGQ
jgi:hypothetical protein